MPMRRGLYSYVNYLDPYQSTAGSSSIYGCWVLKDYQRGASVALFQVFTRCRSIQAYASPQAMEELQCEP